MERICTIFDCDPGVDDAFAIVYLKNSEKFDVKLLASVAGNVDLEYTTRNLRGLVKALDWNVEVCEGASTPIMGRQVLAGEIHGKTGLGGYEFKENELAKLSDRNAFDAMVDILENNDKTLIIAVGPLTNIALLLLGRPDLKEKISEITIMGGGLEKGNTTPAAEFNIFADPEAAEIVFNSGVKINMAGLDVTEKGNYNWDIQNILKESGLKITDLLTEIMLTSFKRIEEKRGSKISLHDVVAVMYHTNPELFTGEDYHVVVEIEGVYTRGQTLADKRSFSTTEKNAHVLLDLDVEKFHERLIEVLTK